MKQTPAPHDLGRRERQIMDVIYRLGSASVKEVLQLLPDPPSYSATRTMVNLLEKKGFLRHHRDGLKYIYTPTGSPQAAKQSAIKHLIKTFFQGSAGDAAAAILDSASAQLSEAELVKLQDLIHNARGDGQ
ncbi:MAG: BlaI/MecI/CopY family transcriptional regulator [Planctomycetota bacterium]